MFIGGLSWQTTQGEPARGAPAGPAPPPCTPCGAPAPDAPARPCALLTPGALVPSSAPRPGDPESAARLASAHGPARVGEQLTGVGWGGVQGASGGGRAGPPGPASGSSNSARTCGSNFCEAAPGAAGTQPERSPTPARPGPCLPEAPVGARKAPREPPGECRGGGGGGRQWRARAGSLARGRQGRAGVTGGKGRGRRGKGSGPGLVRRRVCGYRRAARILRPVRGGEGVSGDAGPPDQKIQVSRRNLPCRRGSPLPPAATHCPCKPSACFSLLTTRRRGFGFVTFMDQAGVDKVLAQSRHELDSKTVSGPRGFGGGGGGPLGVGGCRRGENQDALQGTVGWGSGGEGESFLRLESCHALKLSQ